MMQKVALAWTVVLATGGLVLIAVLFLFGTDLHHAAATGPRWKRRLLTAALTLLSAVGLLASAAPEAQGGPVARPRVSCYRPMIARDLDPAASVRAQLAAVDQLLEKPKLHEAVLQRAIANIETLAKSLPVDGPKGPNTTLRAEALVKVAGVRARIEADGRDLPETPQWKRIMKTWSEAEDAASGAKGQYPFDAAGKKALLADLVDRAKDLAGLAAAGLLTAPEAQLLTGDLARLTAGVQAKRPTEMKMATCYKPMRVLRPTHETMIRIVDRVALLRNVADAKKLHPAAISKALVAIEADLTVLADEKLTARLSPEEQKTAAAASKAARAAIDKIRVRIKKASLEANVPKSD